MSYCYCVVCNQIPCICSHISNVWVSNMTFGAGKEKENPFIESSTGTISVKAKLDYGTLNLIEMYLQGKDFESHKEEYIDTILKLPWVDGNNLKACQTFERLKQLFSVFGGK